MYSIRMHYIAPTPKVNKSPKYAYYRDYYGLSVLVLYVCVTEASASSVETWVAGFELLMALEFMLGGATFDRTSNPASYGQS